MNEFDKKLIQKLDECENLKSQRFEWRNQQSTEK